MNESLNTCLFSVADVAKRTGFSIKAIKQAIEQNYAPGEEHLPRLDAKQGRRRGVGREYLITPSALNDFINALPDA